jgi:hypothetical protein
MTTNTLTHLLITTLLAGSAIAGLQVTATPLASAPVSSIHQPGTEPVPAREPVFLVFPAANRSATDNAGQRLAPPRIVRLTP